VRVALGVTETGVAEPGPSLEDSICQVHQTLSVQGNVRMLVSVPRRSTRCIHQQIRQNYIFWCEIRVR